MDIARGELSWSLLRGGIYSAGFLVVMVAMGLVSSWWAVLAVPAALLIGFAFGGVGMALTTFMRSWQDFEFVTLATMPMFLFSATFFPVTAYPAAVRWVVEPTPLYRGVVLCRELTTGALSWGSAFSVVYLVAMGLVGLMSSAGGSTSCCSPEGWAVGAGVASPAGLQNLGVDPAVELAAHLVHHADRAEPAATGAGPGWRVRQRDTATTRCIPSATSGRAGRRTSPAEPLPWASAVR